jgi:hypothetical protein
MTNSLHHWRTQMEGSFIMQKGCTVSRWLNYAPFERGRPHQTLTLRGQQKASSLSLIAENME